MFKTKILCDRRIYDKKGKWLNPLTDLYENVFYYIKEPLHLESSYANGREQLKETIGIVVYGGKPFAVCDKIILENGMAYEISNFTINYFESNILIKDMLKQRIESMELTLE